MRLARGNLPNRRIVQTSSDKINQERERLKKGRYRQKSYADKRRKDIEFQVGDHVMLKLNFIEEPVAVVDRRVRKLRSKEYTLVNVQWKFHKGQEATWEAESEMRGKNFEFPLSAFDVFLIGLHKVLIGLHKVLIGVHKVLIGLHKVRIG
ncbi:hypothetical protein OSB04_016986 [Centaurea solstitialis]|uniref:Chromo domain-containing protein n=1 Tax=Centaurea solstitialis TaxID=347529 RepID=A0AA38TD34_9ASTR|nr:hypothetical protein OSB04_016986 [Centaurea solstitialis]